MATDQNSAKTNTASTELNLTSNNNVGLNWVWQSV